MKENKNKLYGCFRRTFSGDQLNHFSEQSFPSVSLMGIYRNVEFAKDKTYAAWVKYSDSFEGCQHSETLIWVEEENKEDLEKQKHLIEQIQQLNNELDQLNKKINTPNIC